MKNLTIFPMSSYAGKIAGLIITAASLLLLLAVRIHGSLPFLSGPIAHRQSHLFFTLIVAGLYLTAFSKEKDDDERVRAIRAKAMQSAFMLLTGIMIALTLVSLLVGENMFSESVVVAVVCGSAMAVYLVLFHIGLYFDPSWSYNDDTVLPNLRKNKRFFILYTAGIIVIFAVMYLISKH